MAGIDDRLYGAGVYRPRGFYVLVSAFEIAYEQTWFGTDAEG